jgi:hypothetical protein
MKSFESVNQRISELEDLVQRSARLKNRGRGRARGRKRPLIPAFSPGGGEGVRGSSDVWAGTVYRGAVGSLDVAAGRRPAARNIRAGRSDVSARTGGVSGFSFLVSSCEFNQSLLTSAATTERGSDASAFALAFTGFRRGKQKLRRDAGVTRWCNQATQGDAEVTQAGLEINGLHGLRRLASHAQLFDAKRRRCFRTGTLAEVLRSGPKNRGRARGRKRPLIPAFSPGGGEGVGGVIILRARIVPMSAFGNLDVAAGREAFARGQRGPGDGQRGRNEELI